MEPSTQTSNYDDPVVATQAKNLTKAIFQHESGMDYNAVGDAGTSHGAGQWQPDTWKAQAQDVLGDPNAPMTPGNQSVVAQGTIRKLIKSGKNAADIAAIWNSGTSTGWENKVGTTTINGQQVKYNVPQYVKSVTDLYQQYKGQDGQQNGYVNVPPTDSNPNPNLNQIGAPAPSTDPSGGFISGLMEDLSGTNPNPIGTQIGNTIAGVGNFLFPSVGDGVNLIQGKNTKTPLQLAGDLGSTALGAATLIPGLGEGALAAKAGLTGAEGIGLGVDGLKGVMATGDTIANASKGTGLLSKAAGMAIDHPIASNAALGGAYGVTNALGQGETDPGKIAESGVLGAGTGGLLGAAGGLISKAADVLPTRLMQGVLKNSNPDVAQYALTKSMGTPAKMLEDSDASLKDIGGQLGAALKHENVADIVVPSSTILPSIQSQFPRAGLTPEVLQRELMKLAPLEKDSIDKLFTGEGLTIDELHTLNSAIGANTYKMAFDDPTVKAGKQIGNAFYQTTKKIITGAAPDTAPLFDQYSKEIALNTALDKLIKRRSKAQGVTLRDILSLMGGFAALGPAGAVAGFGLDRAVSSPTLNMKAAGLINQAAGQGVNKFIPAATLGATGLLNQAVNNH